MRLKSIAVRHYRVHRDLVVPLDPALTLIGGPNESGKSTLLEAARHALFLKAKGGGETQKSMMSIPAQGQPEVEVEFSIADNVYRIAKRFSGASGTATLTLQGGTTWQGDAAEEKLSELLGVESISGRGAAEKAEQQWAHLLVSQGRSGAHPADYANAQRESLFARLQSLGGAAVMQSEKDATVAARFRDLVDVWFIKNGGARAGADLYRAQEAERQAAEAHALAEVTLRKLEEAVRSYQEAEEYLSTAGTEAERLRLELTSVEQRLNQLRDLQQREELLAQEAERHAGSHEGLLKAHGEIEKLRAIVLQKRQTMAPRELELSTLKARIEETAALLLERETQRRDLEVQVRTARLHADAARVQAVWFEKSGRLNHLRQRGDQIKALVASVMETEQSRARLPMVDAAKLKTLRKWENDLMQAEAALQAMAAGIEVLATDQSIALGGTPLMTGETRVIEADTELQVGSTVRLRIRPGGGISLVEARELAQRRRASLQNLLDESGLESVQAAADALMQRELKESELQQLRKQLSGMGAEQIDKELAAAQRDLAGVQADLERRRAVSSEVQNADTLEAASEMADAAEKALRRFEEKETTAKGVLDVAARSAREAAALLEKHQQSLQTDKDQLTAREAELNLLSNMHGDDATRAGKLADALTQRQGAEARLSETRRQVSDLQPDLLAGDQQRLGRSLDRLATALSTAKTTSEANRLLLRSEGHQDPHAALAVATARLQEARQHLAQVQRRGQALQLLHSLFQEEQSALTNLFTQPLADKVSGYLQCLFGPETSARVRLGDDNAFAGFDIVRPDQQSGAFQFEVLSGGAREQVAAALRLAMAEVLAAGQPDRCLPLVFDDAFAYSDPTRVRTLQRMLDLASQRGLQIIVLTCNPADYTSLGAQEIRLPVPVNTGLVPAAPAL